MVRAKLGGTRQSEDIDFTSMAQKLVWAGQQTRDSKDVAIFIIGPVGSGKSTFINTLLEEWRMDVGHRLGACTRDLEAAPIHTSFLSRYPDLRDHRLIIVDTPGFDGGIINDDTIFEMIVEWSKKSRAVVGGFVYLEDWYLHSIANADRKNLSHLQVLCGEANANKVVFGTTKWSRSQLYSETQRNEMALQKRHWKSMIDKGSKALRFDDGRESALSFIDAILQQILPISQPEVAQPKRSSPSQQHLKEIVIPVMGATGAGKSSFINILLGKEEMEVSKETDSCTREIHTAYIDDLPKRGYTHLKDYRLVVVDTPGFDDTHVGDVEILECIAKWLEKSYRDKKMIGGIVYLQDITPTRVTGTARRNLQIVRGLCGSQALNRVILATTMWGKLRQEDLAAAEDRERELKSRHWNSLIEKGSKATRFDFNSSSAWSIVDALLQPLLLKDTVETILRIQEELGKEQKIIPETEAGKQLKCTLDEVLQMQKKFANILSSGSEEEVRRDLQEALDKIHLLTDQLAQLKVPLSRRFRRILHSSLMRLGIRSSLLNK